MGTIVKVIKVGALETFEPSASSGRQELFNVREIQCRTFIPRSGMAKVCLLNLRLTGLDAVNFSTENLDYLCVEYEASSRKCTSREGREYYASDLTVTRYARITDFNLL